MGAHSGTEQLLVQVVLRSAQKLLGALRAEPDESTTRSRAADVLRLSFAPIWSRVPFLELTVGTASLLWDGDPVLEAEDDKEGLISALREAGVSSLTLVPGVEASEIHQLLLAVHQARGRGGAGTDLATLMFRADLRLLSHSFRDGGADAEAALRLPRIAAPEGEAPVGEAPAPVVREAVREEAAEGGRAEVVDLEKYDSTLYFLDEREIEYLRSAIAREYSQDLATNALSLLLDTLQLRAEPEVRQEVLEVLSDLLPYLLSEGRFDAVAYLIGGVRKVAHDATDLTAEQKGALDALRASVSEPRAIAQLYYALEDGGVRPTAQSMGVLLRELRPQAISQVLGWSELLSKSEAKEAVVHALELFFTEWPHALGRMFGDGDREVVHSALQLAIRLKLAGFVDPLVEVVRVDDPSTRKLVSRAFAAIGTPPALRHLLTMADDADPSVRLEVWSTFISRPYRGSLRTLEAALSGKDIEERDRREKRALFEAYGAVAGAEGVPTLESILQGKSPAGIRVSAHTRACSAVALGIVGTPYARKALEGSAGDRDPVVRTAVSEALRGGR